MSGRCWTLLGTIERYGGNRASWDVLPIPGMPFPHDEERVEVMPVSEHETVCNAAKAVLRAWEDFTDPEIRVGPVHPRMNDLREALK